MEEATLQIDTSVITLQMAEIKEAMVQTAAEIADVFQQMALTIDTTLNTSFATISTQLESIRDAMEVDLYDSVMLAISAMQLLIGVMDSEFMASLLKSVSTIDIGTLAMDGWNKICDTAMTITDGLSSMLGKLLSGIWECVAAIDAKSIATAAWSAICTAATAVATGFSSILSFLAANPIVLVIAGIAALTAGIIYLVQNWDMVSAKALEVWEKIKAIWEPCAKWFDKAVWQPLKSGLTGIGNFFIGIWNGMINAAESSINWIIGGVNGMIDGVNKLLQGASDLLDYAGISFDFKVSHLNKVSFGRVPLLASGGLAYGKTLAMVGDNPNAATDPEVIAPLSKLENMILGDNDRVVEAIYLLINTLENKDFDVMLDGDSLAEKLEAKREKVQARRGRQAIVCG